MNFELMLLKHGLGSKDNHKKIKILVGYVHWIKYNRTATKYENSHEGRF